MQVRKVMSVLSDCVDDLKDIPSTAELVDSDSTRIMEAIQDIRNFADSIANGIEYIPHIQSAVKDLISAIKRGEEIGTLVNDIIDLLGNLRDGDPIEET